MFDLKNGELTSLASRNETDAGSVQPRLQRTADLEVDPAVDTLRRPKNNPGSLSCKDCGKSIPRHSSKAHAI